MGCATGANERDILQRNAEKVTPRYSSLNYSNATVPHDGFRDLVLISSQRQANCGKMCVVCTRLYPGYYTQHIFLVEKKYGVMGTLILVRDVGPDYFEV